MRVLVIPKIYGISQVLKLCGSIESKIVWNPSAVKVWQPRLQSMNIVIRWLQCSGETLHGGDPPQPRRGEAVLEPRGLLHQAGRLRPRPQGLPALLRPRPQVHQGLDQEGKDITGNFTYNILQFYYIRITIV